MSYRYNTSDSKRYFDWLYHANLDYIAARTLIKNQRCNLSAAFHCQQCIEKALKGYMLFKKRKLFDGHNLTWLCKQAALMDNHFKEYLLSSVMLNKYYIETRYPADIPLSITNEDAAQLLETTTDMLNFICEQLKFDFQSYYKKTKKYKYKK